MPGIVGFIGTRRSPDDAQSLRRMLASMQHEPFYRSGEYVNAEQGVSVGWVCRANAFDDCLPLWNAARNLCLVFCGEEFGDATRAASRRASALLELCESRGDDFYATLNGNFHGLVIDLARGRVTLFNDRFGLARLYCHESDDRLYFASEAKALLAALPELRRLDAASLGEYLSMGCALEHRTLFAGVRQLPGATRWEFEGGRSVRRTSYFARESWTQQPALGETQYFEELKQTFARVLPRYFTADAPVGISLTGGVDSRMVMAYARQQPGSLRTYTFGGMYRDCTDVTIARRVAQLCGQPHQVIEVGNEFLKQFEALAEATVYLTDGAMDVSGTPDLYANRIAREISPVRMTGNYGSEILRRLVAFKPMGLNPAPFDAQVRDAMRAAGERYRAEVGSDSLAFVAFKQVPWHHHSRFALERAQLTLRSPYLDNELVALAFRAPPGPAVQTPMALRVIADGNAALGAVGTDRGVVSRRIPVISQLGHGWQQFLFKAEYAYDYGMPQWLARADNALRGLHLERLFLGRHKFYHFRYWYRHALAPYLRSILLDERSLSRAHVERRELRALVEAHTTGRGNHTLELHRLLSLELLHRRLLDTGPRA
jgi:asparagine synthase (glutamine-hydrolysing)